MEEDNARVPIALCGETKNPSIGLTAGAWIVVKHIRDFLEILLITRNILIINTNQDDKITKETNWEQQNQETPK